MISNHSTLQEFFEKMLNNASGLNNFVDGNKILVCFPLFFHGVSSKKHFSTFSMVSKNLKVRCFRTISSYNTFNKYKAERDRKFVSISLYVFIYGKFLSIRHDIIFSLPKLIQHSIKRVKLFCLSRKDGYSYTDFLKVITNYTHTTSLSNVYCIWAWNLRSF